MQHEENLAILGRREEKVVHRLIPNSHLRTGHASASCPSMRFAFDEYLLFGGTKIEAMNFLLGQTELHREIPGQFDVLSREKCQGNVLKISTDMSIADRTDSL